MCCFEEESDSDEGTFGHRPRDAGSMGTVKDAYGRGPQEGFLAPKIFFIRQPRPEDAPIIPWQLTQTS